MNNHYNQSPNSHYRFNPDSTNQQRITAPYTGFSRGNLFDNLYSPYIQAEPFRLTPTNDRDELLNRVRAYEFAMLELNLYLDNFPHDKEKIRLYNQFLNENRQYTQEFERRYGPLTLDSNALNVYPWSWIIEPWPWEVN